MACDTDRDYVAPLVLFFLKIKNFFATEVDQKFTMDPGSSQTHEPSDVASKVLDISMWFPMLAALCTT